MAVALRTAQSVLYSFSSYLGDEQKDCSWEEGSVVHECYLAPFGKRKLYVGVKDDEVQAYAILSQRVPPNAVSIVTRLSCLTKQRLWSDGTLFGWMSHFKPEELHGSVSFDHLLDWLSREVFLAGSLLTLAGEERDIPNLSPCAILGFGSYGRAQLAC